MSGHCEGVCTPDPMVCALVYGSTREVRRGWQDQKPLIFMHFHEVFLGSQHEIWSKQHNGKVSNFAVDSSGFSTCRFVRWFNKKYGREIDNREWVKVHLMCGVDTKIVTSVNVLGWAANDTPYFVPLLERTAKYFQMQEVSADKAYLSYANLTAVAKANATPFIPFKVNTAVPKGNSIWAEMYHYFMYNREEFLAHYHKRSNVETAFSMIKGKFGDAIRSKSDIGQLNEVLCKVLCHNLCVLIQAIHELGIEPIFVGDKRTGEAYE